MLSLVLILWVSMSDASDKTSPRKYAFQMGSI